MRTPGVTEDLLDLVERSAAALHLPAVRALHLPPKFAWGSKEGEFCALELDDGSIGMSYVLLGDTLAALLASRPGASIAAMPAIEVARWYASADPVARTVGFAAVNAVSQCLFRRAGYVPDAAPDSLGGLDPQPGERIGMVGWFAGLAGEQDGYRVTLDRAELAGCAKVLSTTTVLLNDTLDEVLAACTDARRFAMIGPGGGCLPDPLFARGVTLLGGSAVVDHDGFVDAIGRGAPWGAFVRKYAIGRDTYPDAQALLARLG